MKIKLLPDVFGPTLGALLLQVLSGVTAIAAGRLHTVALLGTGLVMPVSLNSRLSRNELILSWSTNVLGFTLHPKRAAHLGDEEARRFGGWRGHHDRVGV